MKLNLLSLLLALLSLLTILLTMIDASNGVNIQGVIKIPIACTAIFLIYTFIGEKLTGLIKKFFGSTPIALFMSLSLFFAIIFGFLTFYDVVNNNLSGIGAEIILTLLFSTGTAVSIWYRQSYMKKISPKIKYEEPTKPLPPDEMENKK